MNRIDCDTIRHPKSSKGKYVGSYNQGGLGNSYLTDDKNNVVYFDTVEEATEAVVGKSCWSVARIKNPLGN